MSVNATIGDTGMTDAVANIRRYFEAVDTAFSGLDRVFELESQWVKRHNLIHQVCKAHIDRLRNSFACWELASRFSDKFQIDTRESGYPVFQHVLQLDKDRKNSVAMLGRLPAQDAIREHMADEILRHRRFPERYQKLMAERLYYETLKEQAVFGEYMPPSTVRISVNRRTGRPFYVVQWASYDGMAHLPLVYVAVIEDSSDQAANLEMDRKPWPEGDAIQGLPNRYLSDDFTAFVQSHSSYSLTLTTIASALDKDFPDLHPKQLRRFVLGPFYAGGITAHNEEVQGILDRVDKPKDMWLFTWTAQEVYSQEQKPARWGLWGKSAPEEVFYINTEDLDCVQQGVSSVERRALVPHEAFQAVFAQGKTEKVFGDYQCYIASGDNIIRHA